MPFMFIRDLKACPEFMGGDNSILRELLNPLKDPLSLRYSLAHARVRPGFATKLHKIKNSEVYYIIDGQGEMHIDDEKKKVSAGHAVYIPPGAVQHIRNTGRTDLVFICIVDPAWKADDEDVLE